MYIHDLPNWPSFTWDTQDLAGLLAGVRHQQGKVFGRMVDIGFELQQQGMLEALTADVTQSSAIEGERLDEQMVRSSVARRLGVDIGALKPADHNVDGMVDMLLDATTGYEWPLTEDRLFGWHAGLFPAGRTGLRRIRTGGWRDDSNGPMQVVSGPIGRERVHFQAPSAARIEREIAAFLKWYNRPADTDEVLKAGIAHLWFVTIHPFDDGNGRIARAIADMALARSEQSPLRFYSMSSEIRSERADYYEILEQTQKASLDITPWLTWFLTCLGRAIDGAQVTLGAVLAKARFWQQIRGSPLNERQAAILNRMLDGFEGNLTTSKYAKLAKCSTDSALRDILSLMKMGILVRGPDRGRSTSYALEPVLTAARG